MPARWMVAALVGALAIGCGGGGGGGTGGSTGTAGEGGASGGTGAPGGTGGTAGMGGTGGTAGMGGSGGCAPVAQDLFRRGMTCSPTVTDCPPGYVCEEIAGVVLTYTCEIVCARSCECPGTLLCRELTDDVGTVHHLCR